MTEREIHLRINAVKMGVHHAFATRLVRERLAQLHLYLDQERLAARHNLSYEVSQEAFEPLFLISLFVKEQNEQLRPVVRKAAQDKLSPVRVGVVSMMI